MKKAIWITVAVALVGAAFWYFSQGDGEAASPYRFVEVERGDLEAVVSSTGVLEPVTTVEVGTQVSGRIAQIYVDFNDEVKQGQVIALIDKTLLMSAIKDAEAALERNMAQLRQGEREFDRLKPLFEKQYVTEVEYNQARYDLEIAQAAVKSAEINLERAQQNLAYATIYAPIDGTVVERNVEVGQTVAASLSAPILFLIANDLAQMQILANVDESDIGSIQEGQVARFTVQAYPDDVFIGRVRQVRLQSTMQENVVNYTVVIDVANDDGRLLPGMTATVDFLIETAEDVLKVSNAALRFRPTQSMMEAFRARRQQMLEDRPGGRPDSAQMAGRRGRRDSLRGGGAAGQRGQGGFTGQNGFGGQGGVAGFGGQGGRGGFGGRDMTMLWYLDDAGQVAAVPVRTGITDGQSTQITPLGNGAIEPGLQIIAGVTQVGEEDAPANPFQNNQSGGRFRPGGF